VRACGRTTKPLFVRLSPATGPGGWDADATVGPARALELAARGVDLVDCSSGGAVPGVRIEPRPNYQVGFAERVRREAGVASGAVGQIATRTQADAIVAEGRADLVLLGKALLRDPYWPLHAARALGVGAALAAYTTPGRVGSTGAARARPCPTPVEEARLGRAGVDARAARSPRGRPGLRAPAPRAPAC
jgi:2,4-dienoyl-CoA reductase-like NADH-dependent reductase (Old Yellow Enzyme family)